MWSGFCACSIVAGVDAAVSAAQPILRIDRFGQLASELVADCLPGYDQCVAILSYIRNKLRYTPEPANRAKCPAKSTDSPRRSAATWGASGHRADAGDCHPRANGGRLFGDR